MEKYCLQWNEFELNIRDSFRKLREEKRLFDVTLATDDGQHIKAHEMILAAGSNFFGDIFMKSDHTNILPTSPCFTRGPWEKLFSEKGCMHLALKGGFTEK